MSEIPFDATSYAESTHSPPPGPPFPVLAAPFPPEDDLLRSERVMDVGLEVSAGLKVEMEEVEAVELLDEAIEVHSRSATRASRSCSISCRVAIAEEGKERSGEERGRG